MNLLKAFVFFVCLSFMSFAQAETQQFSVNRSNYMFSTTFHMENEDFSFGQVIKNKFRLFTHYDSYDIHGNYEGQGVCRVFCLGFFYTWGTEIDLYDESKRKVGMIDGQVVSSEPAKFSLYDEEGNRIAIAYLDQNKTGFTLVDPIQPTVTLARLTRNFILGTVDSWEVINYQPETVSPLLLKVFAAFACDKQSKFKRDL